MNYKVLIPKPVLKLLSAIQKRDKARIINKLLQLETTPNPVGSQKLKSYENQIRIRVGNYRIRYYINFNDKEIVILDIAHRKDIYKKK
jgi:mRNA interferase RelE/StbE